MKDNEPQEINDIKIGRLPIMLGSNKCNIKDKSQQEIFKQVEKVILIQEQLVDNRIIVEYNNKTDSLETQVQSYHLETKYKASIIRRINLMLKSSSFQDDALFIFFKALGVQNDKEIIQLIGNGPEVYEKLLLNFEDVEKENVYDQLDVLKFIGKSIKNKYGAPKIKKVKNQHVIYLFNFFFFFNIEVFQLMSIVKDMISIQEQSIWD